MTSHLTYLELPANERSAAFYQAVLGWTIEQRPDGSVRFSDESHRVIGRWRAGDALANYQVDSVDRAIQAARAQGGEVVEEPRAEGDTRVARIKDPAGHIIGVWEFPVAWTPGRVKLGELSLYHEVHGRGPATPLVLLHGGIGSPTMFGANLARLAEGRRVIAVHLQAHGRTGDIDRPIRYEHLADDVAALCTHLGVASVDVAGYSLGGGTAMRLAIQHPALVRRLVVVASPMRRDGWYPDVLAGMAQLGRATSEMAKQSPLYTEYQQLAPRVEDWPVLWEKMGDLLRRDYDWSAELAKIAARAMIVAADADSIRPAHLVEMYAALGGGQRDAGWDGSGRSANRLAILPGLTHYDIARAPILGEVISEFLTAP